MNLWPRFILCLLILHEGALAQQVIGPRMSGPYMDGPSGFGPEVYHQPRFASEFSMGTWWPRRSPLDRIGIELGSTGLTREVPDDQILVFDENFDVLLNANELQGSMQFGFRAFVEFLGVSNALGGTDLQFGYFGVNSLDATRSLSSAQVLPVFFLSLPVTPSTTSNIIYSSNIYSGEANLRVFTGQRIRPLVGLRYVKLEDTYDAFEFAGSGRLGGFSLTNNSLFGGQFGAEATVLRFGNVDWFAVGKYGAMHNEVEGSAEAANSSGSPVVKNYRGSSYSSLVDAETGVLFQFDSALSFKLGYQYLLGGKVATGLDQHDAIPLLSPGGAVRFGSQSWHGLNVAAQFSF